MQAPSHAEHHPDPAEQKVQSVPADDGVNPSEAKPASSDVTNESGKKPQTETKQPEEKHDDVKASSIEPTAPPHDSTNDDHAHEPKKTISSKPEAQDSDHTQQQQQADTRMSKPAPAVSKASQEHQQVGDDDIKKNITEEPDHVSSVTNVNDEIDKEKITQAHAHHTDTTPQEPHHENPDMKPDDEEMHVEEKTEKTTQNTNQVDHMDKQHDK